MTKANILIVEDEVKLAELLSDYLTAADFSCHQIHEGSPVVYWVKHNPVDLILLDIMLPGKDGIEICKEIRIFSDIPILMLTAKVEEIDRLLGLELGADDYICKPYSPREVVARVKAFLRRRSGELAPQEIDTQASSLLHLNPDRYEVAVGQHAIALTSVEFHLITKLYSEPGRIFNREQLMQNMYDDNRIVSHRTIDSHIKKLRKKLNQINNDKEVIQSVYGVGYRLTLDT
jgi:two-component system response regulator BaeR